LPSILTERLRLVSTTVALLDAELANDGSLETLLGVDPTAEWPPIGGEHDLDAVTFFRANLIANPASEGWSAYYVCTEDDELIGTAGYFGPPVDGVAEIGYSICEFARRQGFVTEAIEGLIDMATNGGVTSLVAHTRPDNIGSVRALIKNGFAEVVGSERDGHIKLVRPLP
jgi:[ribosomal protein S5]-alanine N-acetyltransferase